MVIKDQEGHFIYIRVAMLKEQKLRLLHRQEVIIIMDTIH
jgi:hypothetical protein